ncbi:MAG: AAA family ATPase [Candidatus Omnitrophota bacterium]|nr:AAA family ATPase [Candidatus Omnitrophota bacterium]
MFKEVIPNFEITQKLAENNQAIVYKAFQKRSPEAPLIIKILKSGYLPEHQKLHFRQKIEQLKVLNDPMLIRPLSFEVKDGIQFITREYFDGIPLNEWAASQNKVSLNDFFTIASLLAQALQKAHESGIIHGGIKPHNILIHPKSLTIRLVDFISSLDVREVSHFIYDRYFVEGTLAYTSPEQTGRINHRVDFASDLYSLGIVFYELLTGKLPFFSLDPLELIHSHLAQEAAAVKQMNSEVPEMLSKLVAMLILKQPEKRYQSAIGLLADLTQCRNDYLAKKPTAEFPLGRHDYTHRITFVSKMVGRNTEAKIILNEYTQVTGGSFRSLFISGLPGIGKTRLIQELQRPIVEHKGYFTSGKFDLYQKNIPYSALIQSLRNLIRTFLTESDERVEMWKQKILNKVKANGKVLIGVIPELEILLGPQPEVPPLPPIESRNRFNYTFDIFLTCLATEENPLTLFIDDLQWCDIATFDFLENILVNYKDHPYFFFIGAYRYNEVSSSHPLTKLLRDIKENKQPVEEIRLGPLEANYCHEMVAYILDSPLSETEELSRFIIELSEGNPLFVSEILSYLHNENLLFLDKNKNWHWDIHKIRESDMPPTVVALFSSKVKRLPAETIELLEYCACMGNRFSPTEISMIKEISLLHIFERLKSALAQGLLMESKDDLQFVHDRVQEAVLSAIQAERRKQIHWNIGVRLLSVFSSNSNLEELDNLFSITAHLNLGKPKVLDPASAYQISDINFKAGNKALDALAAEAANEYFKVSRELLPPDSWDSQYEKTFKIYQKAAKTELMCGDYNNSEKLLNQLLENARTDLDKAESLAEQTTSLSSIGNFIKAIETANRGLAYFDKSLPADPLEAENKREALIKEIESRNIDVWDTILNMPFTQERKSKIELSFYSELIPDLYMSGMVPQLYLSAVQSTQHCLSGGMDESVIYSFAIMGLYLGEKEEFEKAFKYEDLARNLCEKYPNTFGATRGMNGIVWCNMHSRSTPGEIIAYCLKSIQCGKNSGDLYNAGLSYGPLMWNLQVLGNDFKKIDAYASECLEFSKKYNLYFSVRLAEAMQAGWIEPMKRNYSPIAMEEKLKNWEKDNHIAAVGSYYVHLGLAHYYFGEYEKAEEYLQGVRRYLSGLTDNVLKRLWHVFLALNALSLHEIGIKYVSVEELLSYIQPLIKKIETWAALGPLLKPYLAFLYAEIKRVTLDAQEARSLYFEAIDFAHQNNHIFLEAHLHECLGRLLEKEPARYPPAANISRRSKATAGVFFTEAVRLYKKCSAERKAVLLVEKYPEYFEEETPERLPAAPASMSVLSNIDINYLTKSCLIIPAETEEKVIIHKIMNVVLESSGAQHGYLIMEEDGDLIVRAQSHITERDIVKTTNQSFETSKDICHAIIRYVQRTKEIVLLENAAEKGEFKDNPEVQTLKLKSVFCLPVIKQHKLLGILYLENRLSDSVFTAERTEMTKLFTLEAAISLENARLVEKMKQAEAALKRHREHLEEMVEERTRQLSKVQEDLLIAERLAVLGQLAGSISHEIRNPLNVISSSAYYIKMKLGTTDKKLREHIDHIEAEVKNSTAIIDSILSLSGIKEPHKVRLDLVSALNEAIITSEIPRAVKILRQIPAGEIFVVADKEQLFMAFHNILKNALQAMEEQGALTVKIEKDDNTKVKISFIDSGVGISPENINKLFQPLFTTKVRGIGFGLLICKMIIEKHGGTIEIKSKPKKGTTVIITLRLA